MRIACTSLNAFDAESRKALGHRYRLMEMDARGDVVRRGGTLDYGAGLLFEIEQYLKDVQRRVETRTKNPAARIGLSEQSGHLINSSIRFFKQWAHEHHHDGLECGQLSANHIRRFMDWIASTPTRHGNQVIYRTAGTINHHLRVLRGALSWINDQRPPRFPDWQSLVRAVRNRPVTPRPRLSLTPAVLQKFLVAALEYEDPARRVAVERKKAGKVENFKQAPAHVAVTPVSRLFIMLALTGARLGEVLALKWKDIDLEKGRLNIFATKTGRMRIVPLTRAPEGEISPTLAQLLRTWKLAAGTREYVLPHGELDAPVFPKSTWEAINRLANVPRVGPQMLRKCFTSFCGSLGIPATSAAQWQGHSALVAEIHYRQQVLERGSGSIENAMGLTPYLEVMAGTSTRMAAPAPGLGLVARPARCGEETKRLDTPMLSRALTDQLSPKLWLRTSRTSTTLGCARQNGNLAPLAKA